MTSYKNDKPWVNDEYLIQCDICGVKRYSAEIKKRWDGMLCCLPGNCWESKDPIYWIPPVIMDPHTIVEVRPQTTVLGQDLSIPTWNAPINTFNASLSGTGKWDDDSETWNTVGNRPDIWGGESS